MPAAMVGSGGRRWTFPTQSQIIARVVNDTSNGALWAQSLFGGVRGLLRGGVDEVVLWLALLAILVALAVYVITKIRPYSAQQEHDTHNLMAKFRELHSQGGLSDEEYRTIKGTFTEQLREELNDDDDEG